MPFGKTLAALAAVLLSTVLYGAEAKETYKLEKDIPYRTAEENGNDPYMTQNCILDVYTPETAKDFNTVVWLHGGGLTGGNKFIPEKLKDSGIAVIAVQYRLSPKVKGAECLDDAAAAVAWAFNNIERYGGSKDRIFVTGHSAGGYLTAMLGLDKSWLAKYNIDADRIAGLIPLSGQAITHFTIRKEDGIEMNTPVVDKFAPLYHVRKDAPPILLITGDREMEICGRYEENAYLMRMLKVCKHKDITLYEIQGYGHSMAEPAMQPMKNFIARIKPKAKLADK